MDLEKKPRRRVEMAAKIGADSWRDLASHLHNIADEIEREGKLSTRSILGGYSCGHIVITSEDGTIDHDSWAKDLNDHLEAERDKASA